MTAARRMPTLRLVGSQQIRFHEHPERARTLRLVDRLRREKVLRNPPIVAELESDSYLLLDGANRVSAFQELGHSQVPVQVIDYGDPAVQLKGWHHLLLEGHVLDLKGAYRRIPGVELSQVRTDQLTPLLELRRVYAVLVDATATCWGLFPTSGKSTYGVGEWIRVLEQVVAAYEGKAELERIKMADYAHLPEVFDSLEHQLCLFPTLTKIELLELARAGLLIPTGLSRHLVPGRALNMNLPLDFLVELPTEAERTEHFTKFVDRLEVEGRIRYYEEAVFILNE
jgi:L-serine kinase (ATP) / ParB family transcriptional regulator, heme-responsive regulator